MKKFFLVLFEKIIPVLILLAGIYFLNSKCSKFIFLIDIIDKNKKEIIPLVATMSTVLSALVITTLTVFGTTKTYSMAKISKNNSILKRFMVYAIGSLISNFLLMIMSIVYFIVHIKIFIFTFVITICFMWAYSFTSAFIFYKNIKEMKNEVENEEKILGELNLIKREIRVLKNSVISIEEKLNKK